MESERAKRAETQNRAANEVRSIEVSPVSWEPKASVGEEAVGRGVQVIKENERVRQSHPQCSTR